MDFAFTRMLKRSLIVPEVVQTSAMDCGPACLTSLLQGFNTRVSYERLREACQTDVDGTSIDTLEDVAVQLGFDAEQIMVPLDYVLSLDPGVLPAIVVIRLPNNLTHFVVAWSRVHKALQIMDPAVGRTWWSQQQFLSSLYIHRVAVPVSVWREWVESEVFLGALSRKMSQLGCFQNDIQNWVRGAVDSPGWRPIATLEAATRVVEQMVRAGALRRGQESSRALQHLISSAEESSMLPSELWTVQGIGAEGEVLVRGAVLVRVRGRQKAGKKPQTSFQQEQTQPVSSELAAALEEPSIHPARILFESLWKKSSLLVVLTIIAILLSTAGLIVEAMLLRGLLDVFAEFKLVGERLGVISVVAIFGAVLLTTDWSVASALLLLGRQLEGQFRLKFLERLPQIADEYFHSRLSSDMAQRSHSTHRLRLLPSIYSQFMRTGADLVLTAAGIVWLDRSALPLVVLALGLSVGLPLLFTPAIKEKDLKVRNHGGALSRFYLDAMLGLTPLRAHSADLPFRREHDSVLKQWVKSLFSLQRIAVSIDAFQLVTGFGFAFFLLKRAAHGPQDGAALLLMYWALRIPVLAQDLAFAVRQYPAQRNIALRILEPLGATIHRRESSAVLTKDSGNWMQAIAISLQNVSVHAGGQQVLDNINLEISPGMHVAIVGPSGAGKSSLVGLFLGLRQPSAGKVLMDGGPLTPSALEKWRQQSVWVDPTVQLWNRSLLENLQYGSDNQVPYAALLDQADLLELLATLPDGMQSKLGENGSVLSGGEGQRVRFGRAMLKESVRLVILDEPFRGLERQKRRQLLATARSHWKSSTLVCITHDISETLAFDRVLVVESGRIVANGPPAELTHHQDSRYHSLLQAESELQQSLWSESKWRRVKLEDGRLVEDIQPIKAAKTTYE
jgi:ATP-binding cassette subfamily B protein